MLRAYHRKTVERAYAAVASGQISKICASIVFATVVWVIPALLGIAISALLGLHGSQSLYVTVPFTMISILGGCVYLGWVYGRALLHRR